MKEIYAENLKNELKIHFYSIYLLLGNNTLFIKDSRNYILYKAKKLGFLENFRVDLNSKVSLEKAYKICINQSLFSKKQILIFYFFEGNFSDTISYNLNKIFTNISKEILVILQSHLSIKEIKNYLWFKKIINNSILVKCVSPKKDNFLYWVDYQKKKLSVHLHKNIINDIEIYINNCNLLNLEETLKQFSVFFKNKFPKKFLKNIIFSFQKNCLFDFKSFPFVKEILLRNEKLVLEYFFNLDFSHFINLTSLFFLMKSITLNLIFLKEKCNKQFLESSSFHRYVYKKYESILMDLSESISLKEIDSISSLLEETEFYIRECNEKLVWVNLFWISLLFCRIKVIS